MRRNWSRRPNRPRSSAKFARPPTEFHQLQVTQRPTFVIDTEIGDRAVFSGFARLEPLVSALESALSDAAAYALLCGPFRLASCLIWINLFDGRPHIDLASGEN